MSFHASCKGNNLYMGMTQMWIGQKGNRASKRRTTSPKRTVEPLRSLFKGSYLFFLIRIVISKALLEDIVLPWPDCIHCIPSKWPLALGFHLFIITLKHHDLLIFFLFENCGNSQEKCLKNHLQDIFLSI